jgi:hypothetical protein
MITRLHTLEGITLDFDDSVSCLLATYNGYASSADFRDHCEYGLTAVSQKVAEYKKVAWLSDLRKSEIFNIDDIRWVNEYWNVQVYNNGLQYLALVMAESAFAAINIEDFMDEHKKRNDPLTIKLFTDMESAVAWCKEMLMR